MANFYWVGGATSTSGSYTNPLGSFSGYTGTANMDWVLAFDWNNPANWREYVVYFGAAGFTNSTRSPSHGDVAHFGFYLQGVTGSLLGEAYNLPKAMAPCLWGGATQAGITVTWAGGTGNGQSLVGTTFNTSLSSIVIDSFFDRWAYSDVGTAPRKYAFAFLGCPGGIANSAPSIYGDQWSPLGDAEVMGFTLNASIWGGASWSSLVDAVVATGGNEKFTAGLRLKTASIEGTENVGGVTFSGSNLNAGRVHNWGVIQINNLKNLQQFGSGSTSGQFVNTYAQLRGKSDYRLSGYYYQIVREAYLPHLYGGFDRQFFNPRGSLSLEGVTANLVNVFGNIGSVATTPTTNIGTMQVNPLDDWYFLDIKNSFLRESVLVDNGNYGQTAGSNTGGSPNLTVTTPFVAGTTGVAPVPFILKGVYIGDVSSAVRANEFSFGNAPIVSGVSAGSQYYSLYGYPTLVKFQGNCQINKINLNKSVVTASRETSTPPDSNVQVYELRTKNYTVLDLASVGEFDNWRFGQQVGSQILGGIVFESEGVANIVRLSEGVALWNDQVLIGSNFTDGASKRNGNTPTASPSSFI